MHSRGAPYIIELEDHTAPRRIEIPPTRGGRGKGQGNAIFSPTIMCIYARSPLWASRRARAAVPTAQDALGGELDWCRIGKGWGG
eukprot:2686814-Pyramimonas_sp.AAC.1